uniref:Uncharacterized protein n=1 Tax=Cacopsylla melanoneura TaxID=428564 RepID=A0A8D8XYJ8_9HEMI
MKTGIISLFMFACILSVVLETDGELTRLNRRDDIGDIMAQDAMMLKVDHNKKVTWPPGCYPVPPESPADHKKDPKNKDSKKDDEKDKDSKKDNDKDKDKDKD